MPISLKATTGSGGLYQPAANQTVSGSLGIGGITVPLTNVSTATNMLSLTGKYALRALSLEYTAAAAGTITVTLTRDGVNIINAVAFSIGTSAGTLILFNNLGIGSAGDAIAVNSSLVLNVQRSNTEQVSVTANAIALV